MPTFLVEILLKMILILIIIPEIFLFDNDSHPHSHYYSQVFFSGDFVDNGSHPHSHSHLIPDNHYHYQLIPRHSGMLFAFLT